MNLQSPPSTPSAIGWLRARRAALVLRHGFVIGGGMLARLRRGREKQLSPLAIVVCATVVCSILLTGCTPEYINQRRIRENPLTLKLHLLNRKGPSVSPRTWGTLRRYALVDEYEDDAQFCIDQISDRIAQNRDPELIYAAAELSYVQGRRAQDRGSVAEALGHYGTTVLNSYNYLLNPEFAESRNVYDPQFRSACDLYNEALEDALRLLCEEQMMRPNQTYTIQAADSEIVIHTQMRGDWDNDEFDHFEFVSDYEIQTLRSKHTTFGLGVPMIAVRKPHASDPDSAKYYPKEISCSVTAMIRCDVHQTLSDSETDQEVCVLEFFDPLQANQVELANQWVPLETDLTTPLAFFLDTPMFREQNRETVGLINPQKTAKHRGLYMLEPYDPDRIPVLMVHGLWSSPRTWMDMFNDLRSFPEIRERYQFWFYLYPSGQPFWISATQMREDLASVRSHFDPGHRHSPMDQMVLVGHSMGGLISRMQTIESREDFWSIVSKEPKEKLKGDPEQRNRLVSALFFNPNQSVRRVITIGTPHRGSKLANNFTRWIAGKVIKLPQRNAQNIQALVKENPDLFHNTDLLTTATAIDSLDPESPIFTVMSEAKYSREVKFHNIIGILKSPHLFQKKTGRGDGVVAYQSATMPDAESELIVNAEHTKIHMTGQAIYETRRILLQHLAEIDANDRIAAEPEERISLQDQP
ncbi:hypothetical protein [Planctomycetes bacterium SV_7m_r]|uniref:esterase/lipase family protein n=1 Tax=Stieleria bergensis TaxID=2528025 RepID=UPI0011A71B0D